MLESVELNLLAQPISLPGFTLACVHHLVHRQRIPLQQLARHPYPLMQRLAQRIAELRDEASKAAFTQRVLEGGWAIEAGAADRPSNFVSIRAGHRTTPAGQVRGAQPGLRPRERLLAARVVRPHLSRLRLRTGGRAGLRRRIQGRPPARRAQGNPEGPGRPGLGSRAGDSRRRSTPRWRSPGRAAHGSVRPERCRLWPFRPGGAAPPTSSPSIRPATAPRCRARARA